jgi:hypothetical protein
MEIDKKLTETGSLEKELRNGITTEEMKALYFDADALKEAPRTVYRLGGTNQRVYYTFDESGQPFFYGSVTTEFGKVLPTSPHLIDWMLKMGKDEAERYKNERADYGTFLHIECANLLINKGVYDLDKVRDKLLQYIEEKKLATDFVYHEDELKKDILAFAQFCIEYEVKPLAIEIILADEELGLAGAIDLPCEMTIREKGYFGEVYKSGANKGNPKESFRERRIRAILDLKSGRKGFYDGHIHQLEIYKILWNKHFPYVQVEEIFNWSPKEWKGEIPTFNLKRQTDSLELFKTPHYLNIIKGNRTGLKNKVLVCSGEIDLSKGSVSDNFENLDLDELVKLGRGAEND